MPRFVSGSNRIYRVASLPASGDVVVPNFYTSDICDVLLEDDYTVDEPTGNGDPYNGQRLTLRITQDGTGEHAVDWDDIFVFPVPADRLLNPNPNSTSTYEFMYDAGSDSWVYLPDKWDVPWGLVARNVRSDTKTGILSDGSSTKIMEVGISVIAGRTYNVTAHGELATTSGFGTSAAEVRLYYTTNGSTPAGDPSPSPMLTRSMLYLPFDNSTFSAHLEANYGATSNHTLRVLLTAQGVFNGSHTYYWQSAIAESYLMIEDTGPVTESTTLGNVDF